MMDARPLLGQGDVELAPTDRRNPAPSSVATRNVMRANRGRDTGPELLVARELRARGLTGMRRNWRTSVARVDIAFPSARVAVFIHGCFWHGCRLCQARTPKAHSGFWIAKFARNRARDARIREQLRTKGWRVVEIRECQLRSNLRRQIGRIERLLIATS